MTEQHANDRRFTPEQVAALTAVTEPWLSCDGCFAEIDRCIDALADGARCIDEPLRVHLARCPACLEEAETLLTLAAQDRGLDEQSLLEQLRSLIDPTTGATPSPAPTRTSRPRTAWRRRRG